MQDEEAWPEGPPDNQPASGPGVAPARPRASGTALFAKPDYVGWYRELSALLSSGERGRVLFDSTMQEPTSLLYAHARRAFESESPSFFPSTFGWGSPRLIAAIARRYGVDGRSVLATTGCTAAIWQVYTAFLQPGTHAIIETPHFELLPRFAKSRGASISFLPRVPPDYGVDIDWLSSLIQPNTALIVLTNAHNPSGAYLDERALRDIARVANKHQITVLVDEVYGDFLPASVRPRPASLIDPCFISVNSLTKVYGLFGLKCGWIIASERSLQRLRPVYAELESGSSKFTHGIATLILEDPTEYDSHWRSVLARNRPLVLEAAAQLQSEALILGTVPEHGCMYFPRLTHVSDTRRFSAWLWDRSRLALAPGEFFGAPGHIRVGYGQSHQELAEGLALLVAGLREYRE